MPPLKVALFSAYNRDARRKHPPVHSTFCVDDRGPTDIAANGSLYSYFCEIVVDVSREPTIDVRLMGSVPLAPPVDAWMRRHGATLHQVPRTILEFAILPGDEASLLSLADAIESITRKRYTVPAYKYVCPRTAASLRRLADVLVHARGAE